jgi:hypothetical protein
MGDEPEGFETSPERRGEKPVPMGVGILRSNPRYYFWLVLPPSDPGAVEDAFPTSVESVRLVSYWRAVDQDEHYALVAVRNHTLIQPLAEALRARKVTQLEREQALGDPFG